jgi:hypothetical protein
MYPHFHYFLKYLMYQLVLMYQKFLHPKYPKCQTKYLMYLRYQMSQSQYHRLRRNQMLV